MVFIPVLNKAPRIMGFKQHSHIPPHSKYGLLSYLNGFEISVVIDTSFVYRWCWGNFCHISLHQVSCTKPYQKMFFMLHNFSPEVACVSALSITEQQLHTLESEVINILKVCTSQRSTQITGFCTFTNNNPDPIP